MKAAALVTAWASLLLVGVFAGVEAVLLGRLRPLSVRYDPTGEGVGVGIPEVPEPTCKYYGPAPISILLARTDGWPEAQKAVKERDDRIREVEPDVINRLLREAERCKKTRDLTAWVEALDRELDAG